MGVRPLGERPETLSDMIGNVWEWTLNQDLDRDGPSSHELEAPTSVRRVVRPGSWVDKAHRLRCASRLGRLPGRRSDARGSKGLLVSGL